MNYRKKQMLMQGVIEFLYVCLCIYIGGNIENIFEHMPKTVCICSINDFWCIVDLGLTLFFMFIHIQFKQLLNNTHIQRLNKYGYLMLDYSLGGLTHTWGIVIIVVSIMLKLFTNPYKMQDTRIALAMLSMLLCLTVLGAILLVYWVVEICKLCKFAKD